MSTLLPTHVHLDLSDCEHPIYLLMHEITHIPIHLFYHSSIDVIDATIRAFNLLTSSFTSSILQNSYNLLSDTFQSHGIQAIDSSDANLYPESDKYVSEILGQKFIIICSFENDSAKVKLGFFIGDNLETNWFDIPIQHLHSFLSLKPVRVTETILRMLWITTYHCSRLFQIYFPNKTLPQLEQGNENENQKSNEDQISEVNMEELTDVNAEISHSEILTNEGNIETLDSETVEKLPEENHLLNSLTYTTENNDIELLQLIEEYITFVDERIEVSENSLFKEVANAFSSTLEFMKSDLLSNCKGLNSCTSILNFNESNFDLEIIYGTDPINNIFTVQTLINSKEVNLTAIPLSNLKTESYKKLPSDLLAIFNEVIWKPLHVLNETTDLKQQNLFLPQLNDIDLDQLQTVLHRFPLQISVDNIQANGTAVQQVMKVLEAIANPEVILVNAAELVETEIFTDILISKPLLLI